MITIKKQDFTPLYLIACKDWKAKFEEKFKSSIFSDTIDFEEKFVEEMEKACTKEQETIFKQIFKGFLKEDIFSKVTDYKSLCKELGEEELELSDFKFLTKEYRVKALNSAKIQQIEKYFNQDWKPNWSDSSEYKYYPWFKFQKNTWSVADVVYVGWGSSGLVGFYKTEKIANYVGNTFIGIYSEFLNG